MIQKERCMDIWSLARQGKSVRAIARETGLHRLTVKRYLEGEELPEYRKVERVSILEPYKPMVKVLLGQEDYQATRIRELIEPHGYKGSYDVVKRYVRVLKGERDQVAYIRFETMPGLQAQVDFGEFAVVCPDGEERKLYCFVMVLGFSRHMYVEFVDRCTMPVFLDCHLGAFSHFCGLPGEILYDNMKNVVVSRLVGKIKFNDTMTDFACHYRFKPIACPAYSPWIKGKVERPIDYLRESFWRGYVYSNLEKTNEDIMNWVNTTAFERIHGTTKQKVSVRFGLERDRLGNIPRRPYDTAAKYTRKVQKDCRISFGGNLYGIAHKCVGKKVLIRFKDGRLRVYNDNELVVEYVACQGKGQVREYPWIYENLREDKEQQRKKYRKPYGKGKATTIGLAKHNNYTVAVEVRDLSEYEVLLGGGAPCQN
ncbi:MAG: IS21 family transposase [Planctomycetes bacterium]|nr:IS21 family transposase [Planctomycetota bacterium]